MTDIPTITNTFAVIFKAEVYVTYLKITVQMLNRSGQACLLTSKRVNVKFMSSSSFSDIFKTIKGQRWCDISNDSLQCSPGNRCDLAEALFVKKLCTIFPHECSFFLKQLSRDKKMLLSLNPNVKYIFKCSYINSITQKKYYQILTSSHYRVISYFVIKRNYVQLTNIYFFHLFFSEIIKR